jgi:hypothetical protein
MIGDATENISQPSLRIDAIELGRFDQRVGKAVQTGRKQLNFSFCFVRVSVYWRTNLEVGPYSCAGVGDSAFSAAIIKAGC